MDTVGYHQRLAKLAHERGDYLSAARHYEDAANCYPSPEQGEPCLQAAEQELALVGSSSGRGPGVTDSQDRSQGGLGIGLTLARSLVEMHGGSVRAHSDGPGQGSEFVVRLPLLGELRSEASGPGVERRLVESARRILVVDDNVDSADSLAVLLRLMGNDVRTAHDGPAALAAAQNYRPDVVLLDLGLPGMSGYDVCRRLRGGHFANGPLVVALTGYGQDEDRRRTREAGFDRHLVKPVNPDELRELLAEGLGSPNSPAFDPAGAGDGNRRSAHPLRAG